MTKRKLRKGTQLSLANPKNVGRPVIHDLGICHIKREEIKGVKIFMIFRSKIALSP